MGRRWRSNWDANSHHGAMAVNGRANGVLETGVNVCYPKENKKLYEKVERGAIISEFPLRMHRLPKISRFGTGSWPDGLG
jgi:predicted Rossmann fold nucleotide-binding protein DprA/Smf involved in DNA uptake